MLREETKGVHQGFFVTEIVRLLSLKVVDEELQVVGEVVRNLVLSGLSDFADCLDHLLVGSLDVVCV